MPKGDNTKQVAFKLWKSGKSAREAQTTIAGISETQASSVSGWYLDWERGRQCEWEPKRKD